MANLNLLIGARIRAERVAQGAQLAETADKTNGSIAASTLSLLERGDKRWNADNIEAAARGLGLTVSDLLRRIADDADAAPVDRDLADDVAKCLRDRNWHGLAFIGLFEMARAERAKGATPRAVLVDVLETAKEVAAVVIEGLMNEIAARRDGEPSDGDDAGR